MDLSSIGRDVGGLAQNVLAQLQPNIQNSIVCKNNGPIIRRALEIIQSASRIRHPVMKRKTAQSIFSR